MNTERPENDDPGADASAEEQDARQEKGAAAAGTEASGAPQNGTSVRDAGAEVEVEVEADGEAAGAEAEAGGDGEAAGADGEAAGAGGDDDAAGADAEHDAVAPRADDGHDAEHGTEGTGSEDGRVRAQDGSGADVDGPAVGVAGPDRAAGPDEAEAAGPGRRRSPAVIASVAAAVLLVGGGGAYLAANVSGGPGGRTTSAAPGGDTPPPLGLDGYTGGDTGGGTGGIAPGEPNPYGVTYKADGELPDGPGSAPVYRARGEIGKDEVARLAEALGMDGTPVAQGQTWRVGAQDGAGPSLQVTRQAPGTWTFYRHSPGTDDCRSTTVCHKDLRAQGADPVGEETAKRAAAPVLEAVGQGDAKRDASQLMGAQRVVNANPVVGGLPTYGWTTGVTVGADGSVVGGSGRLTAPVKGDTYPVLDAEKTLRLMNAAPGTDRRGGIGGCASPAPLADRQEAPCGAEAWTGAPAKDTLTVEKAVFGLAAHQVDGRQALVPSWLFEVRAPGAQDRFTVTHPAVDPEYLVSPTPSGEPTERPSGPKDEPTSGPHTQNMTVDGYSADGTELTVAFTGGVCTDYELTAEESGDEVTVRVTGTSEPGAVCISIAKVFHESVRLDAPLGDREVVGTDGQKIPLEKPGTRLPRAPEASGAR